VSFHTFTLPEDRCVRLLVKNLGRACPKASYGRSWNPWPFVSRVSHSYVPAVAIGTAPWTALPPPQFHCVGSEGSRGVTGAIHHRALRFAGFGGVVRGTEGPYAMQALPALWTYAEKLRLLDWTECELLLLQSNIASERFLYNSVAVLCVNMMFITGVPAWW
jgi:hypothetical protein